MDLYNYVKESAKIFNQMPGFMALIDTKHKIAWANSKATLSYGYQSLNDLVGKGYRDLRCKLCERYDVIEANEKSIFTLRKKLSFISYLQYADGCKLALCEKSPIIIDKDEVIGLIAYWTDVTSYNLIDMSKFIFDQSKKSIKTNKGFSYRLEDDTSNRYQLSNRQLECLFYLLRGKTDKDIAKILVLSPRTVESYIQEIKFKMQCLTRGQIIEKSFSEGLFNTFPVTFLQKINLA